MYIFAVRIRRVLVRSVKFGSEGLAVLPATTHQFAYMQYKSYVDHSPNENYRSSPFRRHLSAGTPMAKHAGDCATDIVWPN